MDDSRMHGRRRVSADVTRRIHRDATHTTTYDGSMDAMHIDDFYDADERRRESAEYELGDEWTDEQGTMYELSYVEATGELYLMAEPDVPVSTDLFGDFYLGDEPVDGLTVVVIGAFDSIDAVYDAIDGWEDAMVSQNSVGWLHARLGA
jgi:hypothetical protein